MRSIDERYAGAVVSSDLSLKSTHEGAADVLIAAGWAGSERGGIFARLQREFIESHATVKAQAPTIDPVNQRFVAVLRLRHLKEAKASASEMAEHVIRRSGVCLHGEQMPDLIWQAISVWLDPNCGHCTGRMFSGGYDGPRLTCRHCKGTGARRGNTGKTDDERLFIEEMSMEIESERKRFLGQTKARLVSD